MNKKLVQFQLIDFDKDIDMWPGGGKNSVLWLFILEVFQNVIFLVSSDWLILSSVYLIEFNLPRTLNLTVVNPLPQPIEIIVDNLLELFII